MMNQEQHVTLSISQVSKMTGVSQNRIREWHEKEFLPEVLLISVGSRLHRRFTEKDMQVIQRINDYQKQGFVLRVAVEKAKEDIKEEVKK
jgi:DNA-binding transcriptional MerR regulator